MGEKGFVVVCWTDLFFVVILSQLTAVGFARRGSTRSSEGRFPSSRSSPPATGNGLLPALRAKRLIRTDCVAYFFFYGQAAASSRFRRAFAEGEQPVSLPLATDGQTVTIFQGFRLENLFRLPIGLHQLNFHTPQLPGSRPEVPHVRHSVFVN